MKAFSRLSCALVVAALAPWNASAQDAQADRIKTILLEAAKAESQKNFAKAKADCDQILKDPEATPAQKLAALTRKASVLQAEKKPEDVRALYLAALESPTFQNTPEKADILLALGRHFESVRNPGKAQVYFEQAAAYEHTLRPKRLTAQKAVGQALVAQNLFDKARAAFAKISALPDATPAEKVDALLEIAKAYEAEGDFAKAQTAFRNATEVEGIAPGTRRTALAAQAAFYKNRSDWKSFTETLSAFRALEGPGDPALLRNYALLAEALNKPEDEEMAWREIIAIPNLPARMLVEPVTKTLHLLAARRDVGGLQAFLRDLDGKTLTDEQRALLTLLTVVLSTPPDGLAKFQAPSLEPLDAQKQAGTYFAAGKVMMHLRNFEAARFLANRAEAMFAKGPNRLYEVPFLDQAPRGVSGWQNSPLVKDEARREARFEEYNKQAAALLINDVNVARTVSTEAPAKKAPVSFFMAADSFGWNIYLEYKDEEAELVRAGLAPGASLEMFMAPGAGECYFQFMVEIPSGKTHCVAWTSPHKHYRKLDDYLISEVSPIDGGFGVALTIPWELIYDKLPTGDDLWPFGIVDFGRGGAFTWGSGQVHELSRFGKVTFPGIGKALPSIHRWIVLKAYAKYKKSAAQAKVVWDDPETGDPEFFQSVLQPEIARLNEFGSLVSARMSAADSKRLFQEAVPAWMEFDYWIAEMRTRQLNDQLFTRQ